MGVSEIRVYTLKIPPSYGRSVENCGESLGVPYFQTIPILGAEQIITFLGISKIRGDSHCMITLGANVVALWVNNVFILAMLTQMHSKVRKGNVYNKQETSA